MEEIALATLPRESDSDDDRASTDTESQGRSQQPVDVQFDGAMSFVTKVKASFSEQPAIYRHFLEILQDYQEGV